MSEFDDITARDARLAAKLDPDVGFEQIGAVYAKALLGAAGQPAQVDAAMVELEAVVEGAFRQFPRLEALLSSPLVSHEERSGVLERVFGPLVSPLVLNFLKVVSRHGRLDCLRAIRRQAARLREQLVGRTPVRLATAVPLAAEQVDQIAARLRTVLGGDVLLQAAVEPGLIGGAVLRIGDTVYDGSVARQLQSLRQQMIDRSVHEIQSRRDCFRNSAGS